MSRMVSFIVLLGSILVIGFLFYRVMASFVLPLFLAVILVVLFRPLHMWMQHRCGDRPRLSALLTTMLVTMIVFLPTGTIVTLAVVEGSSVVTNLDAATLRDKFAKIRDQFSILQMPHANDLRYIEQTMGKLLEEATNDVPVSGHEQTMLRLLSRLDNLRSDVVERRPEFREPFQELRQTLGRLQSDQQLQPGTLDYQATLQVAWSQFRQLKLDLLGGQLQTWIKEFANPTDAELRQFSGRVLSNSQSLLFTLGGKTTALFGQLVVGSVILVVAMYFFLADGPKMVSTVMRLSPLDDRHEQELLAEFESVSRAVVLATLLSAIVQGLLGGIGYWLCGLESVFLLILLTTVLAMVPFVGAASVWFTTSLWLYFYEERLWAAVLLFIYGATVISMVDNIIKPWVLHGRSRLHPLLALLSVLGGVKALGPIGILVGPMVVVFLQTLLNILHRELTTMDQSG